MTSKILKIQDFLVNIDHTKSLFHSVIVSVPAESLIRWAKLTSLCIHLDERSSGQSSPLPRTWRVERKKLWQKEAVCAAEPQLGHWKPNTWYAHCKLGMSSTQCLSSRTFRLQWLYSALSSCIKWNIFFTILLSYQLLS